MSELGLGDVDQFGIVLMWNITMDNGIVVVGGGELIIHEYLNNYLTHMVFI